MKLPGNEVGISDIIAYRDCPQSFEYDMRRHLPMPDHLKIEEGEKADPPERESYAASYGSAIHDAIEVVENTQCSNQEAIDTVWPTYQHWLEPEDADRMDADLDVYRTRSTTGYRVVGTELELRVALFQHDGEWIYFRGRIDVLYQSIANPAVFLTRDYKSSRFPKSEQEVHQDLQQWAYNFLVYENFPECETLVQQYDQLRYGTIPTQKSAIQRKQIKAWLIRQINAILADTKHKPKANQWCYTCPLVMDCRVTHLATDWWRNRLLALAPQEKVGRKIVVKLNEDQLGFDTYVEMLPKAKEALKVMERYVDAVESALKEMPDSRRDELGYMLGAPRKLDQFDADALRRLHAQLGDEFFHLAGITKKAISEMYGENSDTAKQIMAEATQKWTSPPVKPKK